MQPTRVLLKLFGWKVATVFFLRHQLIAAFLCVACIAWNTRLTCSVDIYNSLASSWQVLKLFLYFGISHPHDIVDIPHNCFI